MQDVQWNQLIAHIARIGTNIHEQGEGTAEGIAQLIEVVAGIHNELRDLKAELTALGDVLVALETPAKADARP